MKNSEDSGRNPYHIAIFHMVSILAGVAQQYFEYYHKDSVVKTCDLSHYLSNVSKFVLETKTLNKRLNASAGMSTVESNEE